MFSPCFQVAFPEPAPPALTCFSWALWGVCRRPLWWRWTQPLSSSASLGKQRRRTSPCRAKMPTLLPHTSEGRGGHGELALQHTRSATPSGRGLGTQGGRPSHEPPHLRDSVRLKCRQSEERKSWSRSLSSSSLVSPGKAVRFLE